jgi:hypothetical protein
MILPLNEDPLHSLDAKPEEYSSKDFSYHQGTAPNGLNKKTPILPGALMIWKCLDLSSPS